MASDEMLLDREVLDETAELGMDALQELLDMYLTQADEIIGALEAAIRAEESGNVVDLAHKLIGSSVVCGVTAMVPPLRALEQQGRMDQLADANQVLNQVSERLRLSRHLLAEYVAKRAKE
jgi:HPt (histidine-containing phosphotransfer) domain-containing protein